MWFEITAGCLRDFEHVTSGLIVLAYSIPTYCARYVLCTCTRIYAAHTLTYLLTHLHVSTHTHTYIHLNAHTHTHQFLLTCPHTCTTVDLSCVMETGVRYCVMCVGVISLGKRTKDLTEAARGPTITA